MLRVTGFCERNSPVSGEFPAQRASNAENVFIWWRHMFPRKAQQSANRLHISLDALYHICLLRIVW